MSQAETPIQPAIATRWPIKVDVAVYAAIGASASAFWWLTHTHVASLPVWAPWEFSFLEYLSGWLGLFWYLRGIARTPAAEHPSFGRKLAFFAGLALIYAVMQLQKKVRGEAFDQNGVELPMVEGWSRP